MNYKKYFLAVVLFLLSSLYSYSSANYFPSVLSDNASISFIACEPGDEVYSVFGHAAIRVNDTANDFDACFHWGLFDYTSENFIYRFVKGETDYEMGIFSTSLFMREYIERQSTVYEAILNLSANEKQQLYKNLLINYQPQNRKYRYNYVFDNCSTRPVDIITQLFDNILNSKQDYNQNTTFRDIISKYDNEGSLLSIGIDIVVASPADKKIPYIQTTAFPIYALDYLENLTVNNKPLVQKINILHQGIDRTYRFNKAPMRYAYCAMFLLIAIGIVLYYYKYNKMPRITLTILFCISTLLGLLIFFLMFVSEHPLVDSNFNILWLNPLHFILIIILYRKPTKLSLRISQFFALLALSSSIIYIMGIQSPCSPIICLLVLYVVAMVIITHKLNHTIK